MTVQNKVSVGDRLPEISLPDLTGRPVALSAYRGRKLLLFVWASW